MIVYSKHAGFVVIVPTLIVKLVAATDDARSLEVGITVVLVLQVTPIAVPTVVVSISSTRITLLAVTAVVFT